MKLTDNEKREILKLLEADKPLPDKYQTLSVISHLTVCSIIASLVE